ncbi:allantoinase AllB [Paenibacillus doosanensis]|uniref:allantoinase AllB n=1 Tax=Paenibacillus doosanensis TaxID=1229154 RepID=UPI00217F9026|nr:allantoinase AllB [Paenibacillus doosanensis]MCS7460644.1 allantoinase AllB [Paenibacillus doosanensis]
MGTIFDTAIVNGTIVLENRAVRGTLFIQNGKIAGMADGSSTFECKQLIDAEGMVILPGAIDPHVHLWEPGPQDYREDYRCGSQAAASGGVTTLIEMPLSVPPVIDRESFQLKKDIADKHSVIDFALWGGLIPKSADHLSDMHELGCVGYKAFISYANDNYPHTPDDVLFKAMKNAAKFNGLIGVHAENADIVEAASKEMEQNGVLDPESYPDGRPALAELEAMERAICFAENAGCRLHIVHMSVAEGGERVRKAKERGVKVSNETCPHYLLFDKSILREKGPFAKCNPPIRSYENKEALWEQLFKGNIDFIGSDHSPYTDEEKLKGKHNIWEAPPGFGGIDVLLPAMISEGVNARGLGLVELAKLVSTNVAKAFELYPKKGTITVGSDADLAIVDLNEEWVYKGESSFSKTKSSQGIYEGYKFKGKVKITMVRGSVVYENGKITGDASYGEFVAIQR